MKTSEQSDAKEIKHYWSKIWEQEARMPDWMTKGKSTLIQKDTLKELYPATIDL